MTEFAARPRIAKVSLGDARRVIAAGEEAARSAGLHVHLVVLDALGDLIAHARMDGAWCPANGIGEILIRRAIDLATATLADGTSQLHRFVSIDYRDLNRRTVMVAAEPLWQLGSVVGAVGVSGLSDDRDLTIAPTAAKVFS
jgi:uncharacterized protein GlcG (DUF336 family)